MADREVVRMNLRLAFWALLGLVGGALLIYGGLDGGWLVFAGGLVLSASAQVMLWTGLWMRWPRG